MVDHVVLFRLKDTTSEAQVDRAIQAINELSAKIPQVLSIRAGRNFSVRGQSHALVLVSQFRNREDLSVYADHPEHKSVVKEFIQPIREDLLVGDIEY